MLLLICLSQLYLVFLLKHILEIVNLEEFI